MANYFSTALGDYLSNEFQAAFTGSTNTTLTNVQADGSALTYVTYSLGTKLADCGYQQAGVDISTILQPIAGGKVYTNSTSASVSYTFTIPTGVTSICIVCVGGSGGNWNRNTQGNGSWFGGTSTNPIVTAPGTVICYAGGGSGSGSGAGIGTEWFGNNSATNIPITQYTGGVVRSGGLGGNVANGGGGGAGGYSGTGGAGGGTGVASTGGGGGGGNTGRGGGGVGLYGAGANGAANGGGGSDGQSATTATGGTYGGGWCFGTTGAAYGGGGGGLTYVNNYPVTPGATFNVTVGIKGGISTGGGSTSGGGAVRIIWGNGRSFPSTNVSTAYNETTN
jgi:hypothetical protein